MKYSIYLFLLLSLAGCVPAKTSHYKPTANMGVAINDHCGSFLAPKSTYQVVFEDVDFRVTGYENYLKIHLRIPKDRNVEIESQEINLINADKNHQQKIEEFSYYDRTSNKSISLSSKNLLKGSNERFALGNIEPRIFSSSVKFSVPMNNTYQVKFPSMKINGKSYSIPIITFKKESGFGLYPINC